MKRLAILLFLAALTTFLFLKSHPAEHQLTGRAMGCQWTLKWRGNSPIPPTQLQTEVAATFEKWEQILSQWRPDSDLTRYNHGETATPELAEVLTQAEALKTATQGAFDPHLLEKVHAAGFGPAGSGIDLSSIGKGYGVDRVHDRLHVLGLHDFVIALAGEIRASGGEWPIEIESPQLDGLGKSTPLGLKNQSIATSGNYRQFHPTAAGLESHIIDPKTGRSVLRPPSSVTVLSPADCATASSWATALFVLGPDFKAYPPEFKVTWQP